MLPLAPLSQLHADLSNSFHVIGTAGGASHPLPAGHVPRTHLISEGKYGEANQGVTPPVANYATQREWRQSPPYLRPNGARSFRILLAFLASFRVTPVFVPVPAGLVSGEPGPPLFFSSWGAHIAECHHGSRVRISKNCADPPVAPKNPSLLVPHPGRCHLPATAPPTEAVAVLLFKSTSPVKLFGSAFPR